MTNVEVIERALNEAIRKERYLKNKSEYYLTRYQIVLEEIRQLRRLLEEARGK